MADFKIDNSFANLGTSNTAQKTQGGDGKSFADVLKESVEDVDNYQRKGEGALTDMATGQVKDLHQAALAINKAESSMKMMLEVRNKAISAYKEILRTQV
ncbi:MAG: flagellar hook-basal body complex protein FliE [Campylobacterales bacterium]